MRFLSVVVLSLCAILFSPVPAHALSLDGLNAQEKILLGSTIEVLDPFISRRRDAGTAPLITFEELYSRVSPEQARFLDEFRAMDPAQTGGSNWTLPAPRPDTRFIRLEQPNLAVQYVPEPAYRAYAQMMAALEKDLGKRLLVESGYRSPAYQLYLFLFYMPNHGYSVRETNRHVALPGFSEHGSPDFQALDFITPEGINGDDVPEKFEELQEFGRLNARAREFGFHLSYPRGGASAYEPWHWHYEGGSTPEKGRSTS